MVVPPLKEARGITLRMCDDDEQSSEQNQLAFPARQSLVKNSKLTEIDKASENIAYLGHDIWLDLDIHSKPVVDVVPTKTSPVADYVVQQTPIRTDFSSKCLNVGSIYSDTGLLAGVGDNNTSFNSPLNTPEIRQNTREVIARCEGSSSLAAWSNQFSAREKSSTLQSDSDSDKNKVKEMLLFNAESGNEYSNEEVNSNSDSASQSQYNEGEVGPLGRRLGRCPIILLDSSGDAQAVNGTIDTGAESSFISERAVIEHKLMQEPLLGPDIKSFNPLISNAVATPTKFVRAWIKGKKAGLDQLEKVHLRVLQVPDTIDIDVVIGMPLIEKFDILSKIQQLPMFDESGNPFFALRYKLNDGMSTLFSKTPY